MPPCPTNMCECEYEVSNSKIGSVFIGAVETVVYGVYFILMCVYGLHFESEGGDTTTTTKVKLDKYDQRLVSIHFYPSALIILLYILTAILLLVGIVKGTCCFHLLWMNSRVFLLIVDLLMSFGFWVLYNSEQVLIPKVRMMILILSFIFFYAVFSHYEQVKDPLSPAIYRYRMKPTQSEMELQRHREQLLAATANINNSGLLPPTFLFSGSWR